MDSFEIFPLVSDTARSPRFETLGALGFGCRLEMMWVPISAANLTSLEESVTSKFVAGREYFFILRVHFSCGVGINFNCFYYWKQ